MFMIASQGLQLCTLGCGVLVFIFELSAIIKDLQYESRDNITTAHNPSEHDGLFMNEVFTRKEYFAKTNRNLWHEPLAITLITMSLFIYGGYTYLADNFPAVEKSLFLTALVNGLQIYFSLFAAMLIFKSYYKYDQDYFEAYVRGVKIHYFGLEKDAYMRLSCYGGYFGHDRISSLKMFDAKKFSLFKDSTETFRSRYHICQESGLKLTSVVLLIISATICICIQWFACCLVVSPSYGDGEMMAVRTNKISPEIFIAGAEGYHTNKAIEITQDIKSGKDKTKIDYKEEVEEVAYSISTEDDIMQFELN